MYSVRPSGGIPTTCLLFIQTHYGTKTQENFDRYGAVHKLRRLKGGGGGGEAKNYQFYHETRQKRGRKGTKINKFEKK